jgi:hypothetical protein
MAKQDQILTLEPQSELKFVGPFTSVVASDLHLTNPSSRRVLFKVKTTAPKRYCVRPNSGIIEPNSRVSVSVMLQPFDYDPQEKNNHKFMVQSLFAPSGTIEQDQLWKSADPSQLMDSKLKCVFEMGTGDSNNTIQNNLDKSAGSGDEIISSKAVKTNLSSSPGYPAEKANPAKGVSGMASSTEEEIRRVQDVESLIAEVQRLREENKKLNASQARLRSLEAKTPSHPSEAARPVAGGGLPELQPPVAAPPIVYLVVMILLGLIIGKFLL